MADVALPPLREELNLFEGHTAKDGAPTWRLHDPSRNLFFNLDWLSFEVLARWHLGDIAKIVQSVNDETTLKIDAPLIRSILQFLISHQLCQTQTAEDTKRLLILKSFQTTSFWKKIIHHYLFFRIPLMHPDKWLSRSLKHVNVFYTRTFFQLTCLVLILGMIEIVRHWEQFRASLIDTFSIGGLLQYGIVFVFVKILHELGHAFTAKRKGCRVPTMGVAFLVMWPMAYTDVNEAWKLNQRRDRLAVCAAGILTELIIAAWATFAWAILPAGQLKEMCFLLAAVTWVSSVLINISPFMRFDGYFLLSDYLDIPNLHQRAFALARWHLRERLFGLGESAPETFSFTRIRGLIAFAWLVWLYRLIIFFGIALLVYHFFFKALGIMLFGIEIGYFIVLPIYREIQQWKIRSKQIVKAKRSKLTLAVLGIFVLIALLPWQKQIHTSGILRTAQYFPIYPPGAGQLTQLMASNGEVVANQPLFQMNSPTLNYQLEKSMHQVHTLKRQYEFSALDERLRAGLPVLQQRLSSAVAMQIGYEKENARYTVLAPFSGIWRDIPPELQPGLWLNRKTKLGVIIDPKAWQVEAFLKEQDLQRIQVGDRATFFPSTPRLKPITLKVIRIDQDAVRTLKEPMLAVNHGGSLMVREHQGQLIPEEGIYHVVLKACESLPAETPVAPGEVVIQGQAQSILGHYVRTGLAVLIRESGW